MFRIALTVALILALPLFAGCGGDEPDTPDVKTPDQGTPEEGTPEEPPVEEPPPEPETDPLAEARSTLETTIAELKAEIEVKTQEATDLGKKIENLTVAELMNAAGMKEKAETLATEISALQKQLTEKVAELANLGK